MKPLDGWRILVIEDEPLIALDLAETLAEAGAVVIGPAHSVGPALDLMSEADIDAAVSDFRLEKTTAAPIAQRLIEDGVPLLFHTSVMQGVSEEFPNVPIVLKPSLPQQLVAAILRLGKRVR